jgi:putative FmdB family regulatory protein
LPFLEEIDIIEPMPIFEYKCDSCEHQFEAFQKSNEKSLQKCPKCKKKKLKKLISSGSFILKGSGFYQNDYKNKIPDADNNSDDS